MIPDFNQNGDLPEGIWNATIEEVKERYASGRFRKRLFEGLLKVLPVLKNGGCTMLFLDGSFVTSKELNASSDYDACILCTESSADLKVHLFPTPGDIVHCNHVQKEMYRGEFKFADKPEHFDQSIRKDVTFLDYFQFDTRTQQKKGIIRIEL